MTQRSVRTYLSLFMVASAFVCYAAFAVPALAAPGDSQGTAVPLNDYMSSSLTTRLAGSGLLPTGHYYFRVQLSAGNTLRVTFQPHEVVNLKAIVLPLTTGYRIVESSTDASGVVRLSFMATKTAMYSIYAGASSQGTFTVTPRKVSATRFSLGSMIAGSRQRPNRAFNVSTKMYPKYNGARIPMKFYVQRRVSGHWKSYTSKTAWLSTDASSYTKFSARFTLPKGKFRVRARFQDAAHPTAKYNAYKTFYVKY